MQINIRNTLHLFCEDVVLIANYTISSTNQHSALQIWTVILVGCTRCLCFTLD